MRQTGRQGALEIVTAVARQRIVKYNEDVLQPLVASAGVVLSSTLGTLPLLGDAGSTLLVRISGKTLTTVIVSSGNLCVYRSTEMSSEAAALDPQHMLDDIFPAVAYFQDTRGGAPDRALIAGFGAREEVFRRALTAELQCPIATLSESYKAHERDSSAKDLIHQELDALVGWMLNGGS